MSSDHHTPRATYRLQLHPGFTFDDAKAIAGYLARLGISHVYCSPYLSSTKGSTHGYDVVDHTSVDEELGGEEGLERLAEELRNLGLSQIVDIVPNHMAIGTANRLWWDVLKNGPSSRYAGYFDIDWDPPESKLKRTILLPVLGDHYGRVLEAGGFTLERSDDGAIVRYYEHMAPLAPGTEPDDPAAVQNDPDRMHELLERQHYRFARWTTAGHELNYRRFFAINQLAALRMEKPEVFEHVHQKILELVELRIIEGLRVDHIDGLRDPARYLQRLRERAPDAYIVVEKILELGEELPADWPIQGTTGYDFTNEVLGVLVDPAGEKQMTSTYIAATGQDELPESLRRRCKLSMLETELATDLERLTDLFVSVCEKHRNYRDFTRHELREALKQTLVSFDVYRTYVDTEVGTSTPGDVARMRSAVNEAIDSAQDLEVDLFEFLARVLACDYEGAEERALAARFQQASGPVMAKGVEDTFFYRYNRAIALNEVGGDPLAFGLPLSEFHLLNSKRQREWPDSMLTTSTHDTKRGEDVRARLALLSEIPDEWDGAVRRWIAMNERHKANGLPDANIEYALYQTLVGAYPLDVDRALAFVIKAAREAKEMTSWLSPNEEYEFALTSFVTSLFGDPAFSIDLEEFVTPLIEPGRVNSLAQVLLKLTSPGVPDIYQGSELWDLSLVDPDNRREVDYTARAALLAELEHAPASGWLDRSNEGGTKLMTIARALGVRRRHSTAFGADSDYEPLAAQGARADHVIAFARNDEVITVAPRLTFGLADGWSDTTLRLPPGTWTDAFTEVSWADEVPLADLLGRFPVALLTHSG